MPQEGTIRIRFHGKDGTIPKKRLQFYLDQGAFILPDQTPPVSKNVGAPTSGADTFFRELALGGLSTFAPETQNPLKTMGEEAIGGPEGTPIALRLAKLLDPTKNIRSLASIPTGLARSASDIAEGLGADAEHPAAFNEVQLDKLGHGLGSIITQLATLRGGKAAAEKIGPIEESTVLNAPRKVVQQGTMAKYAVNKLEKAAAESAEKERSEYRTKAEEAQVKQRQAIAEGRAEERAREAERGQQISKTKELAKGYKEDFAKKRQVEERNAQIEKQKTALQQTIEQKKREFTENTNQVLDNAKRSFDKEYSESDKNILGKGKENPLQVPITPNVEAVLNAQKNIIEGTPENIKEFKTILDTERKAPRINIDDTKGGIEIREVPKTMPAYQLRGIVTELEARAYGSSVLPDVKAALKAVAQAGKEEILSAIRDVHGNTAAKAYTERNARYSDFLTDWRDTSKVNPLPNIRERLLDPVTQKNPEVLKNLDLTGTVKGGNKGQTALTLLNKYKHFGANPEILQTLQKSVEQLKALEKIQKVPQVKKPTYPKTKTIEGEGSGQGIKFNAPKPVPEPPNIEPFYRQEAMREEIQKRLNAAGRIGQLFQLLKIPGDIVSGNPSAAYGAAERMALVELARRFMTSDKALNYFSKE